MGGFGYCILACYAEGDLAEGDEAGDVGCGEEDAGTSSVSLRLVTRRYCIGELQED